METQDLSPRRLVHLFIQTDKLHRNLVEMRMSDLKLHRSQHVMLRSISLFDSPPTQKQLAQKLDISAATVAVTLKKLESAGYITKSESENDSRCNRICLTDLGREILVKAGRIFEEIDNAMLDGMSEEELKQFAEYLEKLQSNLRSCGATLPPPIC